MNPQTKWDVRQDVVEDAGHFVKKGVHIAAMEIAKTLALATVIPRAKARLLIIANKLDLWASIFL